MLDDLTFVYLDRNASSSSLKCCVCGQRCSLKELNTKLDKDLLEYFTDPAIVFERRIAVIKRTIEFQNVHRANLQKRQLEEVNCEMNLAEQI